ncbi:MAG TPA: hypothetical protein VM204_05945 [Gaiellaceae bacterium]|nr:hypothetical protein [Gaiellaceae bacterium]
MVSGGLVGLTGFLFACSSDDTVITPTDAGADGGGGAEASVTDGGIDTGIPDAKPDAPEVFPDAGLTLDNYSGKLAQVLCRTLARCCFGDPNLDGGAAVDGGTYDEQGCIDFHTAVGFGSSAGELPANNTNLVLDNARGNECVAKIDTLTCDTPGAMYTAVAKACFAAIVGKQTAGQACTKSIECAPGHFCVPSDGGAGSCQALRGADGNCGDWFGTDDPVNNAELSGEACSYRGKGVDTGRYCDFYDFAGGDFRPQAEWKCKVAGGVGAQCASTPWCKDALCDDLSTATCVATKEFFAKTDPGSAAGCGKFVKQ